MNILYLITKSEAGGAQTHVYQLCKYFREHHTVTVVAFPGGWLEEQCKTLGVRFIPNPYFSNSKNPFHILRSFYALKRIVQTVRPDIVHCHSSVAGFLGRLVVRKRIPTIYTAHGWGFNTGVGLVQKYSSILAERIVRPYTTMTICVSAFVRDLGIRYRAVLSSGTVVIYNGVEARERARSTNESAHLVFVGRLTVPKRPLLLLQALSACDPEVQKNVRVSIIGDGAQRHTLERYTREHTHVAVEFLGSLPRTQVFDVLKQSDIFVFLSDWEGFPMTILEAMSVGLPVIASAVGGVHEMVDDENGILVSDNEVQAVQRAIERLVEDTALREKMCEVSYERVRSKFSLDTMIRRVEEVYADVVVTS